MKKEIVPSFVSIKLRKEEAARIASLILSKQKLIDFEERNSIVLAKYKDLQCNYEARLEEVKQDARVVSEPGETKIYADEPELRVMVVGKNKIPTYDYELAKKFWPQNVVEFSASIDRNVVADAISRDKLSVETAEKAVSKMETPTASVLPQWKK